jgi:hypothetical protein
MATKKKKPAVAASKAKASPAKKSIRELSESEIEKVSGGLSLGTSVLPGIGLPSVGGLKIKGPLLPTGLPGGIRRAGDEVVQQKGHVGDY